MFGGNSGFSGMIVYDTKKEGSNAVYGYYAGDEMCFDAGTKEEMEALRKSREAGTSGKDGVTGKRMGLLALVYLLAVIVFFVALPLKAGFAALVFCILTYAPMLIILGARGGLYIDEAERESFRKFHGCEHAVIQALTKGKECTMEELKSTSIYDSECGTAYSGYIIALAVAIAMLIVFWPGLLKALGVLLLVLIIILIMILNPKINPFTLLQRPVVMQPTDREYQLGLEIMKRVKEQ